jgi:hypothetical protein
MCILLITICMSFWFHFRIWLHSTHSAFFVFSPQDWLHQEPLLNNLSEITFWSLSQRPDSSFKVYAGPTAPSGVNASDIKTWFSRGVADPKGFQKQSKSTDHIVAYTESRVVLTP